MRRTYNNFWFWCLAGAALIVMALPCWAEEADEWDPARALSIGPLERGAVLVVEDCPLPMPPNVDLNAVRVAAAEPDVHCHVGVGGESGAAALMVIWKTKERTRRWSKRHVTVHWTPELETQVEVVARFKGEGAESDRHARPPAADGPRRVLERQIIDMGKVAPGSSTEFAIPIRNAGNRTLRVSSVRLGCCSCVELANRAMEVPPGETGTIEGVYNAPLRPQLHKLLITMQCNDARTGIDTVYLVANVLSSYEFEPEALRFDDVSMGKDVLRAVTIRHCLRRPFSVQAVDVPGAIGTPELVEITPALHSEARSITCTFRVRGAASELHRSGRITFEVASGDEPGQVVVPFTVASSGWVVASPHVVFFGTLEDDDERPRELELSYNLPQAFNAAAHSLTWEQPPWVDVEVMQNNDAGLATRIRLTPRPQKLGAGMHKSELRLSFRETGLPAYTVKLFLQKSN